MSGYELVDTSDGSVCQQWGGTYGQNPSIPERITLPNGDCVYSPVIDKTYDGFVLRLRDIKDPRFYNSDNTIKPIEDCIAEHVSVINSYVASSLQKTDWMITRAAEGYKPAPASVVAYRAAVRDQGNALASEVRAMTDIEEVIAWQPHDWPAPL